MTGLQKGSAEPAFFTSPLPSGRQLCRHRRSSRQRPQGHCKPSQRPSGLWAQPDTEEHRLLHRVLGSAETQGLHHHCEHKPGSEGMHPLSPLVRCCNPHEHDCDCCRERSLGRQQHLSLLYRSLHMQRHDDQRHERKQQSHVLQDRSQAHGHLHELELHTHHKHCCRSSCLQSGHHIIISRNLS